MENKNNKNKKINIPSTFMGIFVIVLIILLLYFIGVLIQFRESGTLKNDTNGSNLQTHIGKTGKFSSYFPECGLIHNDCLDTTCGLYFLCNEEKYLTCEIYDCGKKFGIGTEDKNGKIDIKRKIKQDMEKIIEMVNKCDGEVEIINNVCDGEKFKLKAKVITAGDCRIEGFTAVYIDSQNKVKSFKSAEFFDLGDSLYSIELNDCNKISEIIAIGEGGVGIKGIINNE